MRTQATVRVPLWLAVFWAAFVLIAWITWLAVQAGLLIAYGVGVGLLALVGALVRGARDARDRARRVRR